MHLKSVFLSSANVYALNVLEIDAEFHIVSMPVIAGMYKMFYSYTSK